MNDFEFPIGYKFIRRQNRKTRKVETVVDHLTTYNSKGEVVRYRYVTEHTTLEQPVRDYDVVTTTIRMGEKV